MPISERDKRTLTIGGSVVGFFLVVFLVYKLFLSGGGDATLGLNTGPAIVHTTPSPSVSASPSGHKGVVTFSGRDPYCVPQSYVSREIAIGQPLPADAYYCPGVIVPTTSASASASSSGSASTTGTPTSSTSAPSAPTASSATVGGQTVVLLSSSVSPSPRAQVGVEGNVYTVAVGTRFAGGEFRLQGVQGRCASFLYGDQAFSLCDA
jgi:hypothetical protein